MSVISETYMCPVCGEKDSIEYTSSSGKLQCLSCGYDNKASEMSKDFITL